jgi:hypothetical protein
LERHVLGGTERQTHTQPHTERERKGRMKQKGEERGARDRFCRSRKE